MATKLDSDPTKPSVVEPGDAPADTTDPTEHASTLGGDKSSPEAQAAGTVNAAVPVGAPKRATARKGKDRFEEYEAERPDGSVVKVRRNIETGATEIV